jgi:hypothetical protein
MYVIRINGDCWEVGYFRDKSKEPDRVDTLESGWQCTFSFSDARGLDAAKICSWLNGGATPEPEVLTRLETEVEWQGY